MWTIDKSFIPFDARSKYSSKIATCLNHVSAIYISVTLVLTYVSTPLTYLFIDVMCGWFLSYRLDEP